MLAVDHIIICGIVQNIKHFIEPLRSATCEKLTPIVILHEDLPTSRQWQQLQFYQQIYFVQGSPLQETSYDRVNIKYALQVVVLSPNIGIKKKAETAEAERVEETVADEKQLADEENLLDAKTIFKYNIIKKKNPNVRVVTELINQHNIAFLLQDPLLYHFLKAFEYDQTPVFTSGEVYLSSLMDSLVC